MGKRLKIAIIAPFYVPFPGGQEVHTKFLVDHLRSYDVDITIITTNEPRQNPLIKDGNVKIIRLKPTFEVMTNPFCIELFSTLMHIDADVFHVQGYWSFYANVAAIVAKLRNIPLIYTSHGFQQNLYKRGIIGRFFVQFYLKTVGHLMFQQLDAFTCNHAEDKQILSNIGVPREKIHIIPSGLDTINYTQASKLVSDEDLADVKNKFNLHWPTLFYIGRLIQRKGCHYLLRALPIVKQKFPETKLLVIGDGPEKNNFEALAKKLHLEENVIFTGYIKPLSKTLISLYRLADIQILPSFSESMPVSIMEGLFFGVPQMVTDRHFSKWIQYEGNLLYVPINPVKTNEFGTKIIQLLKDEEYRNKIKIKGPEFVEEKLAWERLAKNTLQLYKIVLNENKIP